MIPGAGSPAPQCRPLLLLPPPWSRQARPRALIHVGDDEILLDDSLRYGARHPSRTVLVWAGMPHVFPANVGMFHAAGLALEDIGAFVRSLV